MRVYISADIEGVTGVVSWGQAGAPRAAHYDWEFARRMMTHDVNAAIRGARAAGAQDIVVKDSHGGSKNLLIDQLEPDVELISGHGTGRDGMMEGLDSTFDCAMLVGYHGMAGTLGGIMEHTITGMVHRYWINDMPAGEIAMSAATAGQYGVPLVFVSSDAAGCAEASALIPGISTVAVKVGMGRYMGRLRHPSVTGPELESAVRSACRSRVEPWCPTEPVRIRIEHNRGEEADAAAMLPNWERVDGYTVSATCANWPEAHVMSRRAMANAGMGAGAND